MAKGNYDHEKLLHLIWLSCTDFKALSDKKNKADIDQLWKTKKKELAEYFEGQKVTFERIQTDLNEIILNINPQNSFCYDPERFVTVFNLWSLFLDKTPNSVILSLPWKLSGQLVHEHNHYLFLKKAGMIGKDKETLYKFYKDNWVEAEVNAFAAQIEFLKLCEKKIASSNVYFYNVTEWSKDGKPNAPFYKIKKLGKPKIVSLLKSAIDEYESKVMDIRKNFEYVEAATQNDISQNSDCIRFLALPVDPKKIKAPFDEIKLRL